ncbi:MAG TPA: DUF2939 domain-containing protein [Xanthobacteraceae bacterium]|nr:DUF2939 domain-containing protein [Xanthobacteraceae bacterium]
MRWISGIVVVAVALIVVYYGSAFYSLSQLLAATRAGDGAAIVARTDLPRLSRSLSEQIVNAYLDRISAARRVGTMERMLVGSYGATVADVLVAKMLTSENLTQLLTSGQFSETPGKPLISKLPSLTDLQRINVVTQFGRMHFINPVKLSIRVSKAADPEQATSIVLHRSSLTWKLAGIELPRALVRDIAATLPAR